MLDQLVKYIQPKFRSMELYEIIIVILANIFLLIIIKKAYPSLKDALKHQKIDRSSRRQQMKHYVGAVGGPAVSFGSDAHTEARVGYGFEDAVALAESAGFRPGQDRFDFWRR